MTKGLSHLYASNGDTTVPKNPGVSEVYIDNMPQGGGGGGAVDSVNGKTGTVVLDASDVGALPASTPIPTKTSDLTNDSGFITSSDIPAQVNADWNETDPSDPSYIENKPSIPAAQVNSDWNAASGVAQILNKPSIPTATSDLTNDSGFITSSDIPAQVQADWDESDSSDPSYIQNKPSIPAAQVNSDWNAASGVAQILNKPTIPTATSDLTNDSGFITSSDIPAQVQADWSESDTTDPSYIQNKPEDYTLTAGSNVSVVKDDNNKTITIGTSFTQAQANWNESNSSDPSYIQNKPTIPTVDQTYDATSANAQSGVAVASAISAVPQVPASTSADEGKVLTVDSNGDAGWATPSGGGSKVFVGPSIPSSNYSAYQSTILRFSDDSYDPTTKAYASNFTSITKKADCIYEFKLNSNSTFNNLFNDEYLKVEILGHSHNYSSAPSYREFFANNSSLVAAYNINIPSSDFYKLFYNDKNLERIIGVNPEGNRPTFYLSSNSVSFQSAFENCISLKQLDVIFDQSANNTTLNINKMFLGCWSLASVNLSMFRSPPSASIGNSVNAFDGCSSLETVVFPFTVSYFNTSTYSRNYMFSGCSSLKTINNAEYMKTNSCNSMFYGCKSLSKAPELQLSGSRLDLSYMFYGSGIEEMPSYDYSTTMKIEGMFGSCSNLKKLDSTANFSNTLENVAEAFMYTPMVKEGAAALYGVLSNISTVDAYYSCFSYCGALSSNDERSQIPTSWGGTAT